MENEYKKNGLTSKQVIDNRNTFGENTITPVKKDSIWKLIAEKFDDPIIRILIIAAILSFVIAVIHNDYIETIGIISAIILATGIGFWFEYDASRKFDILNSVNDDTPVRVIRDSKVVIINKKEVVVGDVVLLESGEEVPADGILVESTHLNINESSLTGEPSISKTIIESQFKKEATYPSNMVLRGTTVLEGNGVMVVEHVGDTTEYGKVSKASTQKSEEKTPLTIQLDSLAKVISVIGFTLASLTFLTLFLKDIFTHSDITQIQRITTFTILTAFILLISKIWLPILNDAIQLLTKKKDFSMKLLSKGWGFWCVIALAFIVVSYLCITLSGLNMLDRSSWITLDMAKIILNHFMIAVTLIVVAVPEGLPMSVTLSLALNMRRMLKSNNLVRKMHACETMGAITVICTDKTGTLTQNRMSVVDSFIFDTVTKESILSESIAVNSTAHINTKEDGSRESIGNPTESALLLWLDDKKIDYKEYRDSIKVSDRITFSTERKYMATMVNSLALKENKVIYIKGAPEVIIDKCDKTHDNTPFNKQDITSKIAEFQNKAMRTLGFAYKVVPHDHSLSYDSVTDGGFIFLGVSAIEDPVREEVPAAIQECTDAGISVKIVTGDTSATAKEIARRIGLWSASDGERNHITGVEFEALSDEELLDRVFDIKIMSRARPTDKQRFVRLLQSKGAVVAVTGDGTNDAPALNFAHVGLSMGTGTSVAKEASDITLIDDSFNSIATAVMWGRSLYKNIQRFLLFQLTINVIAVSLVFIGAILGSESPLTITQMLWVNLIMDTFAAAALASLPPSRKVMKDKPRRRNDFIITKDMTRNILTVGFSMVIILLAVLEIIQSEILFNMEYGMSVFFTIFVMIQFWNMYNAKCYGSNHTSTFSNIKNAKAFILVSAMILLGQILIVSFGGKMFRTVPITTPDWIYIIVGTSLVLWVGEISRFILRKKTHGTL